MTGTAHMLVDVPIVDIQCKFVTESCHGCRSLAPTTTTDERTRFDAYAASVNRRILIVRTLQMELEALTSVSSCLCLQQHNNPHRQELPITAYKDAI